MKTFYAKDFEVLPGKDAAEGLAAVFDRMAKEDGEKELIFDRGTYFVNADALRTEKLYITNTVGDNEWKSGEEPHLNRAGMRLKGIRDLTVEGRGAVFVLLGQACNAVLTDCERVTVRDVVFDLDNDVHYLMGTYYEKLGRGEEARTSFEAATRGDLRVADMNYYNDNPVEYVFYAALAFGKLGNRDKEKEIKDSLLRYCAEHADDRAEIDYFAVSLPDMLVWDQDIAAKNRAFTDKVKALAAALEEDLCSRADRRHRDKDRRGSERVDRAQIRHAVMRVRISGSFPTRRRREIRRLDSVEERSRGQTALCLTDG